MGSAEKPSPAHLRKTKLECPIIDYSIAPRIPPGQLLTSCRCAFDWVLVQLHVGSIWSAVVASLSSDLAEHHSATVCFWLPAGSVWGTEIAGMLFLSTS